METGMITVEIELNKDLVVQAERVFRRYPITLEQALIKFFNWCIENPEFAGSELLRWRQLQEEVPHDGR